MLNKKSIKTLNYLNILILNFCREKIEKFCLWKICIITENWKNYIILTVIPYDAWIATIKDTKRKLLKYNLTTEHKRRTVSTK